ncbi:3-isopropylmalate dehydratase small subunit [Tardibacter chloracetimidivorans]|uniref:3-isopropylmalate dehydratase small subunit n=1 Tax=Tardibacter chloracetimidivorans TaxID=1921510 RepID=A0A1L3ZST0_9SPHN|nr:3-isopropylmalate dehydratase small subunit [Tardibacter chloracetimidivorans]API58693.1 3-isopropylmalate dehydratase small subunit [Tardibacter chloracetimidivorans]
MEPFCRLDGIAASLPAANIDTDKILAAAYLKTTLRSGLGKALFSANRYTEDGQENADFVLNQMPWRQTKVLVTGPNFGCGSSREHAPWALLDFGIRCIVAPSFADIFFNNCFKNGILAVTLADDIVAILAADARSPSTAHMVVDLESQTLRRSNGEVILFEVDPARKRSLLLGWDDIEEAIAHLDVIEAWESAQDNRWPSVPVGAGFNALLDSPKREGQRGVS